MLKAIFFDLGNTLVDSPTVSWRTGAREALQALRADYELGIISNTSNLTRAQLADFLPSDFDFGLFKEQLILLSSEGHEEKPALGIFAAALQQGHLGPLESAYCSENPLEVLAAQKAGLVGIRIPQESTELLGLPNLLRTLATL